MSMTLFSGPDWVWAGEQLAVIAAEHDLKKRIRALTPLDRGAVVQAIAVVAESKAEAYAAALRGERPSLHGWIAAGGPLVDAVATLQQHLVPVDAVPMREARWS